VRDNGLVTGLDRNERTESLTVGLNGVAPVGCGVENREMAVGCSWSLPAVDVGGISNRPEGGVGEWRAFEESGVGDARPVSLNLEGDRERDLRNDRTAEPTST